MAVNRSARGGERASVCGQSASTVSHRTVSETHHLASQCLNAVNAIHNPEVHCARKTSCPTPLCAPVRTATETLLVNATLLTAIALALAWWLTGLYLRVMLAYGHLEPPSDRGMHKVPVPSGAG